MKANTRIPYASTIQLNESDDDEVQLELNEEKPSKVNFVHFANDDGDELVKMESNKVPLGFRF